MLEKKKGHRETPKNNVHENAKQKEGHSDIKKACVYISKAVRAGVLSASLAAEAMTIMGCGASLPEGQMALKELTPEQKKTQVDIARIDTIRSTIETDLATLRVSKTSKGPHFLFEEKALKDKISSNCDMLEKDAIFVRDSVTREVDKAAAQRDIDFAKATRDNL